MDIYEYESGYLAYLKNENKVLFSINNNDFTLSENHNILNKCDFQKKEKLLDCDLTSLTIIFITTTACNFRCKYCYEFNSDIETKHTRLINKDFFTADKMINAYIAFKKRYINAEITISFFGGEPFLAKEEIYKLVSMIEKYCVDNNCKIPTFSAITNASILDDKLKNLIINKFKNLTVSLDGIKILHDENRVFADGHETFDTVYKNILELKKINFLHKLQISCEVTLTDAYINNYSSDMISDIWSLFRKLNISNVGLIPVRDNSSSFYKNMNTVELIIKDFIELWSNDIINGNFTTDVVSFSNYVLMLVGKKDKTNLCAAGTSYFAVTPDQSIFPCQVSIFYDQNKIGTIDNQVVNMNTAKGNIYHDRSERILCRACDCYVGCSTFCKIIMQSYDDFELNECKFEKLVFKNMLFKLYDLKKKGQLKEFVKNYQKKQNEFKSV